MRRGPPHLRGVFDFYYSPRAALKKGLSSFEVDAIMRNMGIQSNPTLPRKIKTKKYGSPSPGIKRKKESNPLIFPNLLIICGTALTLFSTATFFILQNVYNDSLSDQLEESTPLKNPNDANQSLYEVMVTGVMMQVSLRILVLGVVLLVMGGLLRMREIRKNRRPTKYENRGSQDD